MFMIVRSWAVQRHGQHDGKTEKKSTQKLMPDKDTPNHICLHANYFA